MLGCCRLGRIIPFNLAYRRMFVCCIMDFFLRIVYGRDRFVFFLFVFVVGIPIWHFTYPAQLLSYPMFLAKQIQHFPNLLSFSIFFSSSPVLSRSTKTTIFIKLFFIFCFLLFSCCCVFVFASHERKKNVTIALLEQHTFTLLLLFDL